MKKREMVKDDAIQKNMQRHFNGISHQYYNIVNQFPFTYGYYHKRELEYVINSAKMYNPKKILDAGCATGKNSNKLKSVSPSSHFCGADFSLKMIEIAKKDYPDNHFVQSDITNMSFKSNSFDMVYSLEVLEHLPDGLEDVEKAIKELIRVTKPNGVILFEFPNAIHGYISGALSLLLRYEASMKHKLSDQEYEEIYVKNPLIVCNTYSLRSILNILRRIQNCKLIRICGIRLVPLPFYEILPTRPAEVISFMDTKMEDKIIFKNMAREFIIEVKKI